MLDPVQLSKLVSFAEVLTDTARRHTLPYFRTALAVEHKADESPVTQADRETEQVLRDLITRYYPEHGIYGEEFTNQLDDQRLIWVIDPIDGTKSFISGVPTFGTLIALLYDGKAQLGIIDMPALKERWQGSVAAPTLFNQQACQVRNTTELQNATLFATAPEIFHGENRERFKRLEQQVRLRRYGGDCYAYGLLAAGFIDLVVEAELQPFDYSALINVIQGAGGVISDWQGRPLTLQSDGRIIAAATHELHQQTLQVLAA